MSYVNQSLYEEAEEKFQKALELSGENLRIKSWLAYTYARLGFEEKATGILTELAELSISRYIDPSWSESEMFVGFFRHATTTSRSF